MAKFELKALITGVDKLSPTLKGINKKIVNFKREAKGELGRFDLSDLIKGGSFIAPFVMGSKAAIDFESEMANVRKVVDFDTPEQFKRMGNDILNMSKKLPMAADDIAKIVAAAGEAGIAKNELTRFAEDAVKMGVAFNTTAEESGDTMKVWRTGFKLTQDEVVTLADKINYLGNTGAKVKDVANIVTRVGALGNIAGVAAGEVSAMAATLSKVGVRSEIGATGLKNFMLALTQGSAATKKQQLAFKALQLDSKKLAVDMQKNAKATILDVLTRLEGIDRSKQTALLTQIFGKESIEAISPLLDNLALLKTNFKIVGDATQYAGSMQKEYNSRAATTANNIQLLKNKVTAASISLGDIFLPTINDTIAQMSPFINQIGELIKANPELVKTVAAAGAAFIGLKLTVFAVGRALAMTPMGLFLTGMALAAGYIITNWKTVGPFFKDLWNGMSTQLGDIVNWFRELIGLDPIDFKQYWADMGLVVDDLRGRVTKLIEEFVKYRDLIRVTPVGFDKFDANTSTGTMPQASIEAMRAYKAQQAAMAMPALNALTTPSIVNPQAQKVNGEILVKFDNAPAGMRVEAAKTDSPLMLKTQQKVGRRNIGAN